MNKPFVTINGTQGNKNRGRREFVYSQRESLNSKTIIKIFKKNND